MDPCRRADRRDQLTGERDTGVPPHPTSSSDSPIWGSTLHCRLSDLGATTRLTVAVKGNQAQKHSPPTRSKRSKTLPCIYRSVKAAQDAACCTVTHPHRLSLTNKRRAASHHSHSESRSKHQTRQHTQDGVCFATPILLAHLAGSTRFLLAVHPPIEAAPTLPV